MDILNKKKKKLCGKSKLTIYIKESGEMVAFVDQYTCDSRSCKICLQILKKELTEKLIQSKPNYHAVVTISTAIFDDQETAMDVLRKIFAKAMRNKSYKIVAWFYMIDFSDKGFVHLHILFRAPHKLSVETFKELIASYGYSDMECQCLKNIDTEGYLLELAKEYFPNKYGKNLPDFFIAKGLKQFASSRGEKNRFLPKEKKTKKGALTFYERKLGNRADLIAECENKGFLMTRVKNGYRGEICQMEQDNPDIEGNNCPY